MIGSAWEYQEGTIFEGELVNFKFEVKVDTVCSERDIEDCSCASILHKIVSNPTLEPSPLWSTKNCFGFGLPLC